MNVILTAGTICKNVETGEVSTIASDTEVTLIQAVHADGRPVEENEGIEWEAFDVAGWKVKLANGEVVITLN